MQDGLGFWFGRGILSGVRHDSGEQAAGRFHNRHPLCPVPRRLLPGESSVEAIDPASAFNDALSSITKGRLALVHLLTFLHAVQLGKKFKSGNTTEELPEYARATHLLATLGFQVSEWAAKQHPSHLTIPICPALMPSIKYSLLRNTACAIAEVPEELEDRAAQRQYPHALE